MTTRSEWRARPFAIGVLKAVILLVPVATGTVAGLLLAERVPPPVGVTGRVAWSILILSTSTLVLLGVERAVRRLAPLTLLLRLSLVFPDQAPKRFGIALRAVRPGRQVATSDPGGEAERSLSLLARLLAHDRRTRGHSERVAAYAEMIGAELGIERADRSRLVWAALLHDIGKLEVPGPILNKPDRLDAAEWEVMSGHPAAGGALVEPLAPWLGDALRAVDGHHERFDGTGYPKGVPAADLPQIARIVAVADAFETMTAARSYKEPMPISAARREVAACAGSQFDPVVCRAFLALSVPRLWRVAGPLSWLAQVPLLGLVVRGDLVPVTLSSAAQGAVAATGQAITAAAVVGGALVASGVTAPLHEQPVATDSISAAAETATPTRADVSSSPVDDPADAGQAIGSHRPAVTPPTPVSNGHRPDRVSGPVDPGASPTPTTTTPPTSTTLVVDDDQADDGGDTGPADDGDHPGSGGGGGNGGNSGSNGGGNSGSTGGGNGGSNGGGNGGSNGGGNGGSSGGGNGGSGGSNGGGNSGSGSNGGSGGGSGGSGSNGGGTGGSGSNGGGNGGSNGGGNGGSGSNGAGHGSGHDG